MQLGHGAPDLARVLPEVRDAVPGLPDPPSLDPDTARFRLFDSLASFLRSARPSVP